MCNNFNMMEELSIKCHPIETTFEWETFGGLMNPSIMRALINVYEANKYKGLSDDALYAFLLNKWEEILGMPSSIRLSQMEIDCGRGGCCGGSKREVCTETATQKEEGRSSIGGSSKSDRRSMGLDFDKEVCSESEIENERGGGCCGGSKRDVCTKTATKKEEGGGCCSGPSKREVCTKTVTKKEGGGGCCVGSKMDVCTKTATKKEEGGGCCGGPSKREVYTRTVTKKEEGGGCCGGPSKREVCTKTVTKKEGGGGCCVGSKMDVCTKTATKKVEGGGCCGGPSKREVCTRTVTKKEGGGGCCVGSKMDVCTKTATRKEEGGGCCGGPSKREVGGHHETEGDQNIRYCSCCCGPRKRIFMVDDSLVSCKLSKKIFASCGHTITVCTSGSEAINFLTKSNADYENADEFPFDILFLDIVMPEIDGIQVLDCIKSLPYLSKIPVVMLSALEDGDLSEKCLKIGAIEVIQKPLKCTDVKAVLSKLKQFGKKYKKEPLVSSPSGPHVPPPSRPSTKSSLNPLSAISTTRSSSPHASNYTETFVDSSNMLEPPSNLEVGSSAPIASVMLCNHKGQMVRAIPKDRVSVILLLPGTCASKTGSINDLVYVVMDIAREQGRVGDVSLFFITPEEENIVLPGEIDTDSFASRVTVDDVTWKAFLGVTHTFTAGLLVVDGEGTTVFSWSNLVDHDGNLCNPENCVCKNELMSVVRRAERRTLLGTPATLKGKRKVSRSLSSSSCDSFTAGGATEHEPHPLEQNYSKSCDGVEMNRTGMLNILVVDDSLMSCKLGVRKLQSLGCSAEYMLDGTAAIEVLRERPTAFDLVLLDIVMPDVDGMEVLSKIRSDSGICNVLVIMLSGLVENDALTKRLVDSGASGVLRKPLDGAEVVNLVSKTIHVDPNPLKCSITREEPE